MFVSFTSSDKKNCTAIGRLWFVMLFCLTLGFSGLATAADDEEDLAGFDESSEDVFSEDVFLDDAALADLGEEGEAGEIGETGTTGTTDGAEVTDDMADTSTGSDESSASGGDVSLILTERVGYGFDKSDPDIMKMRSELAVDMSVNPTSFSKFKMALTGFYDLAYEIQGRSHFSGETLDEYESGFEVDEAYLDVDLSSWANLRLGRQFFGWGETENKQISDIGNPRDFRVLGLQDIDDVRLAVGAAKLTFYGTDWAVDLAAIHEIRPHRLATIGSEFDPYVNARSSQLVILDDDTPATSFDNTEFLARLFLSRSWGDVNFFWGEVYEDLPHLELTGLNAATSTLTFTPEYRKTHAYGAYGNVVSGSWIFKYELARKTGLALRRSASNILQQVATNPTSVQVWDRKNRLEWMGGVEYGGISETTIMVEYLGESIEAHNDTLADHESSHAGSIYVTRDFFHDKLAMTFWWTHDFTEHADLYKIEGKYDYNDHLQYTLGIAGFLTDDVESFYYPYRRNDRINAAVQYAF